MAVANTSQIFSSKGQIAWQTLTTANTAKDGTGTVALIFTADASNGGRVERVRAVPLGTNTASVLRIFINNGSDPTTAANNTIQDAAAYRAEMMRREADQLAREEAQAAVSLTISEKRQQYTERVIARQHMGTLRRLGMIREGGFRGNFEILTITPSQR